jgi:hypothetical protein
MASATATMYPISTRIRLTRTLLSKDPMLSSPSVGAAKRSATSETVGKITALLMITAANDQSKRKLKGTVMCSASEEIVRVIILKIKYTFLYEKLL